MILKSLHLHNFKAFRGEHDIEFASDGQLLFLRGVNKVNPRMGANGVGKSTIWDAVCWCLFGKTLCGLRAKNVHSWNTSGSTAVALKFSLRGRSVKVARSWSPNSLKLSEAGDARVVDDDLRERPF
jgi:DNA repair exonuclease SbcCD ATPase subunit